MTNVFREEEEARDRWRAEQDHEQAVRDLEAAAREHEAMSQEIGSLRWEVEVLGAQLLVALNDLKIGHRCKHHIRVLGMDECAPGCPGCESKEPR